MVTSVGNSSYFSYLNQLQGKQPAAALPPVSTTSSGNSSTTNTTPAGAQSSTSASLVSSLLSGGSFSPEVLSLLQQNGSGGFDPISNLLGGTSTSNPLTSLYANLFATSVASSLTQAKTNGTQQAQGAASVAQASPVQSLLNGISQASAAYNKANLQNAQNIIAANSYRADGVTPLLS